MPARLLYSASETDADMLYATGFFAPDPFLFVQKDRLRVMVMSDLEMDRAKKQARVDRVVSWTRVARRIEARGRKATVAEVVALVLRDLGLRRAEVPRAFPLGLAMDVDASASPHLAADPFWAEREIKNKTEVGPSRRRCARRRRGSPRASRPCAPAASAATATCAATPAGSPRRTCAPR